MTRREAQRIATAIEKQTWRDAPLRANIMADQSGIRIDPRASGGYAFLSKEQPGLFILNGRHGLSGTPTQIAIGIVDALEQDASEDEREALATFRSHR